MRYKLFLCVALFLCGTPLYAQTLERVALMVDTLTNSTVPTTIRTGEPFTQVYKISYIRVKNSKIWNKEVKEIQRLHAEKVAAASKP